VPPNWQVIRQKRNDLTDWLIHWTRGQKIDGVQKRSIDVLKHILQQGYLRPGRGIRYGQRTGREKETVRGPQAAVCFTEQPLSEFVTSCHTLSQYTEYGLAFRKLSIYQYGGRPAIYGDDDLEARLHEADKYLWVGYNPEPEQFGNSAYPNDFTQEREWRTRSVRWSLSKYGLTTEGVVPLALPPTLDLPVVLVRTAEEKADLRSWLAGLPEPQTSDKYLMYFYDHRMDLKILPVRTVASHIHSTANPWAKLETVPEEEWA
jgi:hypothetical protein